MLKIFKLLVLSFCLVSNVHSEGIANCESPSGHAYYPNKGVITKKDAGWHTDKISNGKFTLNKNNNQKYDLLFIDSTKKITSTIASGGEIFLMRKNVDDAAFIIAYADTIEIYNFWKATDGKLQFSMLQNKGSALIPKSSLMVGSCEFINFDRID